VSREARTEQTLRAENAELRARLERLESRLAGVAPIARRR